MQTKRAYPIALRHGKGGPQARLFAVLCVLAPTLFAQPDAVTTSLRECFAITDDTVRVACYDALARQQGAVKAEVPVPAAAAGSAAPALPAAATPDSAVPAPAAVAQSAPEPAVNAASERAERVAEFGRQASVTTESEDVEVLLDTVTRVVQVEPTKLQVTLASGQVWRQAIGKNFILREGERVRIRSTGWGEAYRLSVEGRPGYIQVSRTR